MVMRNLVMAGSVALVALTGVSASATDARQMAAFPKAKAGQTRHVINLPALKGEDTRKVEIIVGQTVMVDCNRQMFGGALQERTAQGWGYNYYVLENLGQRATTLMGCPNNTKRREFVRSSSETIVRYNSRLPLVIYTSKNVEVRYRVWTAGAEQIVR